MTDRSRRLKDALLVAVLSTAASGLLLVAWWGPLALLLTPVVVLVSSRWIVLLARRDPRALIALWLIFALNRTLALIAPDGLAQAMTALDDVALGVALIVVCATGVRLSHLPGHFRLIFGGLVVFALSGALAGVASGLTAPAVLLGTWLGVKLGVCLLVTTQFSWSDAQVRTAQRVAAVLIAMVVAVALLQVLSPGLVNQVLGATSRTRVGQGVITSIFREPAQYSVFMMFALSGLIAAAPLSTRRWLAVVVVGVGALLSLRLKAVVDLILVIAGRIAVSPARLARVWAPIAVAVGGGAAAYLAAPLLQARSTVLFGDVDSAREILYATARSIADGHVPFGAGFGSFGSEASISYYSPVYAEYQLDDTFGFSEKAPSFIHDASWATVLGETGWLGAAAFATALTSLLLLLWRHLHSASGSGREECTRAALLFAVVFVADSITSPQLFAGFACLTLATLVSMTLPPQPTEDEASTSSSSVAPSALPTRRPVPASRDAAL